MDPLQAPAPFAVLTVEPDIMRAHWIAGGIEAAGIPVHVEEDDLADEYSMFQKMLGAPRVRVLVPEHRLEEARTVFLGLSQPIPLVDEDDDEGTSLDAIAAERSRRIRRRVLLLILGFALLNLMLLGVFS